MILLVLIQFSTYTNHAHAEQAKPDKLVFVYGRPEIAPTTQWLILIVEHALAKLDIEFEFLELPSKRASLFADIGEVDGELGRVFDYGNKHRNLVRVGEHHTLVTFCAFSIDPNIKVDGWSSLTNRGLRVEYRVGLKKASDKLPGIIPAARLLTINTVEQGIGRLMLDRSDIYVDILEHVFSQHKLDYFRLRYPQTKILIAGELETTTGHFWLHKKHANLEPDLSSILRDMKASGKFQEYLTLVGLTAEETRW